MIQIERISMAPKSQEASQMHQNQIHKEQARQENIQNGFAFQISHNSKQTVKTSKSENGDYLDRKKEKNKSGEKKQNKNKKQNENQGSFDFKV